MSCVLVECLMLGIGSLQRVNGQWIRVITDGRCINNKFRKRAKCQKSDCGVLGMFRKQGGNGDLHRSMGIFPGAKTCEASAMGSSVVPQTLDASCTKRARKVRPHEPGSGICGGFGCIALLFHVRRFR
jgi:hypothetical protein